MDALERSVAYDARGTQPLNGPHGFSLLWVGSVLDGIAPWGTAPKQRDRQLREFATAETYFAGALGIVAARNAAMSWRVTGDERTASAAAAMLNNANFGGGWEEFVTKVTLDLSLCDSGAFVEIIRAGDSPNAPVIGINHLDSLRCFPTGDPETPVIYEDVRGAYHAMKWYQVVQLLEMAAPTTFSVAGVGYKLGYSNATRVLRAAQILRNIEVLKDERTGGRFMRALHIVSGVDPENIRVQMARAQEGADNAGLLRYVQPPIVASVDPNARIDHKEIALATMPDRWDEEKALQAYILALSMGFAVDYQEFAPLPSGNIGTGQQSEILHQKGRGKGPGLFRQLFLRLMNLHGVLPANVEFEWDIEDLDADQQQAEVEKLRAETRGMRIQSGELTPEEARQIALDDGDLSQELFEAGGMADVTPDVAIEGEEPRRGTRSVFAEVWPDPYGLDYDERALRDSDPRRAGPDEERLEFEDDVTQDVLRGLGEVRRRIAARLRAD